MPQLSQFTVLDVSEEKSLHEFYNGAITAASLPGFLVDFGAYRTALDAIILGTIQQEAWIGDRTVLSNVPPVSNFAQRELKLLVRYIGDISSKIFRMEIPTPDLASITLTSNDFVLLADVGIMAAWVTAFETLARTPDDNTETVTVLTAQVVGRNI